MAIHTDDFEGHTSGNDISADADWVNITGLASCEALDFSGDIRVVATGPGDEIDSGNLYDQAGTDPYSVKAVIDSGTRWAGLIIAGNKSNGNCYIMTNVVGSSTMNIYETTSFTLLTTVSIRSNVGDTIKMATRSGSNTFDVENETASQTDTFTDSSHSGAYGGIQIYDDPAMDDFEMDDGVSAGGGSLAGSLAMSGVGF